MTPEERAEDTLWCAHSDQFQYPCNDCIAAAIRAAVEEEREACAEIAAGWDFGVEIAAEIRGRKG